MIFFDSGFNPLSYSAQLGIARHELGHTVGLGDHSNNSNCSNYTGIMGQNPHPCNTFQITCSERRSVNTVHDRGWPC